MSLLGEDWIDDVMAEREEARAENALLGMSVNRDRRRPRLLVGRRPLPLPAGRPPAAGRRGRRGLAPPGPSTSASVARRA
ncbi:MAG: hypothetical protein KIT58_00105 [Planctomycetota bacterium]|nr:hypothetical protein [Planctomycetota bacterium]